MLFVFSPSSREHVQRNYLFFVRLTLCDRWSPPRWLFLDMVTLLASPTNSFWRLLVMSPNGQEEVETLSPHAILLCRTWAHDFLPSPSQSPLPRRRREEGLRGRISAPRSWAQRGWESEVRHVPAARSPPTGLLTTVYLQIMQRASSLATNAECGLFYYIDFVLLLEPPSSTTPVEGIW